MKLCGTVTCPRLEGVPLCGDIPIQPVMGGLGVRGARVVSSLGRMAATALVEVTARIGGMKPEPGASQSFSSAQQLSQPEVGPRGGKQELRGRGVSPALSKHAVSLAVAVSAWVGCGAGATGAARVLCGLGGTLWRPGQLSRAPASFQSSASML